MVTGWSLPSPNYFMPRKRDLESTTQEAEYPIMSCHTNYSIYTSVVGVTYVLLSCGMQFVWGVQEIIQKED
jgi:hypothetical protein